MIRHTQPRLASRQQQAGVGLIEVLIAVLVVSIGFLGVAALQVYSLSTNNSAMARSMATIASYSILDAMRADRVNALNSVYNTTVKAGSCPDNGDTLASRQLHEWCQQLGQNLGATDTTTGNIDCTGEGDCTITLTFDDSRATQNKDRKAEAATQTITTEAML